MSQASFTRRNFLSAIGGGMGTLAASVVAANDGGSKQRIQLDPIRPYAPRAPQFAARAKSVIVLFLVGGPSSMDSFDYKPQLQQWDGKPLPASIRNSLQGTKFADVLHGTDDKLMASPFRWQQYGDNGMWISELFPNIAKHVDKLCFLHSLQADSNNHAPASYQLHSGDVRAGKASLGSWVTYGLGSINQDLPSYVVLFDAGPLGGAANYSNGFLPAAFQPTHLRSQGSPVLDLKPPDDLAMHQRDSLDLIGQLNIQHRQSRVGFTDLEARIASYELAYRMQASALEIGDLADETQYTQTAYALDHEDTRTRSFGRKCLMARRLVERGVRFVQLYDMPDKDGWDAHDNLVANHTDRARWTDQPMGALLEDLSQRGLLDETLVICMSEFGRTPTVQGKNGRQHNAAGFTIWMAGAGSRPGRIGATDEFGLLATERPIQFRDLHATILHAMGLHHEDLFFEVNGRQERLTGVAGSAKVVTDVFA
jgi:Protein of unknown function (DUF1501)